MNCNQEDTNHELTDGPFAPLAAQNMKRIQKRRAAKEVEEVEADAYLLEMYSHTDVAERAKFAERQKDMELLKDVLHRMRVSQAWRSLTPQPANYNEILDGLKSRYPHFHAVIEALRARMRLNALKKYPVLEFGSNILLLGAPGCGKSAFLSELGEALVTRFASISCASMSMAGELSGLSAGWSTGRPGMVFEMLVLQGCANPIMLLDEVDKTHSEGSHQFQSALYGLLEKNDARRFKDEFVSIAIDASRINWFASANDITSLNAAIRDRFEVINVAPPGKDELRQILPQMYLQQVIHHGLEHVFSEELASEVIESILTKNLSIRRMKSLIESAMANASVRAASSTEPLMLKPEDIPQDESERTHGKKIGFVH